MADKSIIDAEAELDLANQELVDKFKTAGDIANEALELCIAMCKVGTNAAEICVKGDDFITEKVQTVYTKGKMQKGIAWPTCVAVNEIVQNLAYLKGEERILKEGDLVKISLGVQIDGYPALVGHTVIVTDKPEDQVTGRMADVVCAAHFASEIVLRMCKPGTKSSEIIVACNKVAHEFECEFVEGVMTQEVRQFVLNNGVMVLPKAPSEKHELPDFTMRAGQCFIVDVCMSTGEGRVKLVERDCSVYERVVDNTYQLKMKSSRTLFTAIKERNSHFAFSLRHFDDIRAARLGLTELVSHELIAAHKPVTEKEGEYVAEFRFTVLITPNQTVRITKGKVLPFVSSDKELTDKELKDTLSRGLKRKKKRTKKKKAATTEE